MVTSCCHGNMESSDCGLELLFYIRGNNGLSSTSSNELSFAIFPAETRSCLKLTSALYHSMIVVEEWICWKIFQCKRVMREKYLFSQLRCCHSLRVTKAGSRQLRFAIFPDKTTNVFNM